MSEAAATQLAPPADPLVDGIVDVLMEHCKTEDGAVDFGRASGAFVSLLAEMIGPQTETVQKKMVADVREALDMAVKVASLRSSIMSGVVQ